jgi:hypothetical protein
MWASQRISFRILLADPTSYSSSFEKIVASLAPKENMAAEIKKEIQLEIAHVLFMNLVAYSKVSISDRYTAVNGLNGASHGMSNVCAKLKHGGLQK